MKTNKYLHDLYGTDEYGLPDLPVKVSNVQVSRAVNYMNVGGCVFCFPHGMDTYNCKYYKLQRNWKKYRRTQYKTSTS